MAFGNCFADAVPEGILNTCDSDDGQTLLDLIILRELFGLFWFSRKELLSVSEQQGTQTAISVLFDDGVYAIAVVLVDALIGRQGYMVVIPYLLMKCEHRSKSTSGAPLQ